VKQILSLFRWLVILLLIIAVAFFIYVSVKINQPYRTNENRQVFSVPAGTTTKEVARSLEDEGLISSAFFFELHVYLKKIGEKIQAGNYEFSPSMSIGETRPAITNFLPVCPSARSRHA